jgi:hypothetical protein
VGRSCLPATRIDLRRWRITLSCHRHRVSLFIVLCCLAFSYRAVRAGIANSIRTATPVSAGNLIIINKDISTQVKAIVDGAASKDAQKIKQARQTLIDNADNQTSTASPAYQAQYAASLDKALSPLTAAPNPRQVRLNSAIILGQVAERVARTDAADVFADVATSLLQSKDFESQLWGLKIAKFAMASDADKNSKLGGGPNGLDKIIVKTVENSKYSGDLIEEAYLALKFDPLNQQLQGNQKLMATLAAITLPDILDLIEWRTQQFRSAPPVNPRAELALTGYLAVPGGFDAVNAKPEIRDRTLKAVGELTCAQLKAISDTVAAGATPDQDLIEAAKNCGSAMASFGNQLAGTNPPVAGADGVAAAGQMITGISLTTPEDKLKTWCDGLAKALQGMNIQVSMP